LEMQTHSAGMVPKDIPQTRKVLKRQPSALHPGARIREYFALS
jgi:hypothetical protein